MQQKLPLYYVNWEKDGQTIVARAMVFIQNIASIRVMEKAGLKFEKIYYDPHSSSPDVLIQKIINIMKILMIYGVF